MKTMDITDEKLICTLRSTESPIANRAAQRIEDLKRALGVMLESYGGAIREIPQPDMFPLPSMAIDVLKGYFKGAKTCNAAFHADEEPQKSQKD